MSVGDLLLAKNRNSAHGLLTLIYGSGAYGIMREGSVQLGTLAHGHRLLADG